MSSKRLKVWLHGWQIKEILALEENQTIRELTIEGNHFEARADGKGHFEITLEVEDE